MQEHASFLKSIHKNRYKHTSRLLRVFVFCDLNVIYIYLKNTCLRNMRLKIKLNYQLFKKKIENYFKGKDVKRLTSLTLRW